MKALLRWLPLLAGLLIALLSFMFGGLPNIWLPSETRVDTLTVTLQQRDTVVVHDTTVRILEIETERRDSLVYVYPTLFDIFEQPLFRLEITARLRESYARDPRSRGRVSYTRQPEFRYSLSYKPLIVHLEFQDHFNLKKGLRVYTVPELGNINVDWHGYRPPVPLRLEPRRIAIGLGYSRQGLFVLSELWVRRSSLGMFLQIDAVGVYYKRAIW